VIQNATILRVDTPGRPTTGGARPYTEGEAIDVRCCLGEPTTTERMLVDQLKITATATLYVRLGDLPPGVTIDRSMRVRARSDAPGAPTVLYRVEYARTQYKAELSHLQCLLRAE
jgi:hypothetical protein